MKKTAEEIFDEIEVLIEGINQKIENKIESKDIANSGKKNSHLHLLLETSLMNKIQKEANEKEISISELVRQKLREKSQLDRIENKLDVLLREK